jgi:hypothetical protein
LDLELEVIGVFWGVGVMMMEKFRDCIDAVFLRRNPEFFVKSIFHGNFFFIIMIFFAAVCFIFYELASFGHRVLVFVQKQ